MSAAEGSAAAQGLARLLQHLFEKGILDRALVSDIRDDMLLGLDPSVVAPDDTGLQLAYKNTLVRYQFVGTSPRELLEPDSLGAAVIRALTEDL